MYLKSVIFGGVVLLLSTSVAHAVDFNKESDVEPTTPVTGYSIKRGSTASPLPTTSSSPEPEFTPAVAQEQNRAPVARAGQDQTVPADALVVLSASESRDADGSIASYNWKQISGPGVELLSSRTAHPSFFAEAAPATHIFALTVRDDDGMTAIDVVTIAVRPRAVISPVLDITPVPIPMSTPTISRYTILQNSKLLLAVLAVVLVVLVSIIARVVFKPESS